MEESELKEDDEDLFLRYGISLRNNNTTTTIIQRP
jgi:hypothetical protein